MSKEYDNYIVEHVRAVRKAAEWMLQNLDCANDLSKKDKEMLLHNVALHDDSKRGVHEYKAYDDYFYGTPNEDAFNRAWLHHIHNNPHHWQHWVLVNDDGDLGDQGKMMPLEMPKVYALEMVADWWSFSWRSGKLTEVFDWYDGHRDHIILHPRTRQYVERVLSEMGVAMFNREVGE